MKQALQNNLIFLHLPKNGGATFNALLNRLYSKNSVYQIRLKDNKTLTTQDFIDLPASERAKIKVLKGHMFYGLHKHLIGPSEYITFLRQPEKRILSFYNFIQNRPNHRLYNRVVGNQMTFADFVNYVDAGDIHNAQIRFISGLTDADEEMMLQTALANIEKHFSFVGLQEHYNESLILLKNIYKWGIPYYKYKNKVETSNNKISIDAQTKKLIEEKNAGDIKLYHAMEEKFWKDIKQTKGLKSNLTKLNLANTLVKNKWGSRVLKLIDYI